MQQMLTQEREPERKIELPEPIKKMAIERLTEAQGKTAKELLKWASKLQNVCRDSTKEIGLTHMADLDFSTETRSQIIQQKIANCREILKKISLALLRLSGGRYGLCAQCDKEINLRRLQAVPWADLCTSCEDKKDKRKKRLH